MISGNLAVLKISCITHVTYVAGVENTKNRINGDSDILHL